jgi:hypothetical protein
LDDEIKSYGVSGGDLSKMVQTAYGRTSDTVRIAAQIVRSGRITLEGRCRALAQVLWIYKNLRTQFASAPPENDRQPKEDYGHGNERRSGDVGDEDQDDRDSGKDGGNIVAHSFPGFVDI